MYQALRIPDFRLLWGAGLVSSVGSWLLVLAVPAHILAVTGSLRDTGLTLAAAYLPHWPRRTAAPCSMRLPCRPASRLLSAPVRC